MFFYAHAHYAVIRNRGVADPMRIFGALLPDSALTGVIGWDDLHNKKIISRFQKYLGKDDEPLGLGLIDHYELDLKSHGATGYAFSRQTPELRALVARASGLEMSQKARGLAHNFIEAGVDINLLRHNSSIIDKVHQALEHADNDAIATQLSTFFNLERVQTKTKLLAFADLIKKHDLQDMAGWIALWVEIIGLLLNNAADEHAIKAALLLAIELTASDYQIILTKEAL